MGMPVRGAVRITDGKPTYEDQLLLLLIVVESFGEIADEVYL